jgi:transcriptional/translational regulatory protein YebC/TACO1
MFERKGLVSIPESETDEESLMDLVLEAGADDVRHVGQNFEVTCSPDAFAAVCEAVDKAGFKTDLREITRIPKDTVDIDGDAARAVLKLMDMLDDHDDVQKVAANFNIPDEALAAIEGNG